MAKYLNKVGVIILILTISLITACSDDTPSEIPDVQATIDAAIELGIKKIPTPAPLPTPTPTPLPTPTPTPLPTPTPTPLPTPTPTPLPTPTPTPLPTPPTPLPTPTPTPLPTPTPTPLPTPTPTPLPTPTPTPLPTNEPKLKSFSIINSNLSRDLAVRIAFSSSLEGVNDVRLRFKNVSNPNRGLYTQSCFVFTNLSGNTTCTITFSATGDFWTENGKYSVEEIEIKSPNSIVSRYKSNGTVIPDINYLTLNPTTHNIRIYSLNLSGSGFSIATEKIYMKSLHFNNDIYRRSGLSNGDTFDLLVKFSSNVLVTSKEYDATTDTTNKAYIIFSLKNISDSNESGKLYMIYHSGSGTDELTFRGIIPTTTKQGLITPSSNNQAIKTNGTALIKDAIPGTFLPLTEIDLLFANQGPSRVENIFSQTATKTYSADKVLTTYTYSNFAMNALSQVSTTG